MIFEKMNLDSKMIKNSTDDLDLQNEEVVTKILENHDVEGMAKLCEFHHLTSEQIELFSQYAIQRKFVLEELWKKGGARKEKNLQKTSEEEKLGVFIEQLEPQVRDAVLKISAKGYKTYESGYQLGAEQTIGFSDAYFNRPEDFRMLKEKLQKQSIELKIEPDHINLSFDRLRSLDEIKQAWDMVADGLPEAKK